MRHLSVHYHTQPLTHLTPRRSAYPDAHDDKHYADSPNMFSVIIFINSKLHITPEHVVTGQCKSRAILRIGRCRTIQDPISTPKPKNCTLSRMQLDRALKVVLVTKNSGKNILVHSVFTCPEWGISACITILLHWHISLHAGAPTQMRIMINIMKIVKICFLSLFSSTPSSM